MEGLMEGLPGEIVISYAILALGFIATIWFLNSSRHLPKQIQKNARMASLALLMFTLSLLFHSFAEVIEQTSLSNLEHILLALSFIIFTITAIQAKEVSASYGFSSGGK